MSARLGAFELDAEGRVRVREDGKRSYRQVVTSANPEARDRWQRTILAALDNAGVVGLTTECGEGAA